MKQWVHITAWVVAFVLILGFSAWLQHRAQQRQPKNKVIENSSGHDITVVEMPEQNATCFIVAGNVSCVRK